MIHECIKVIVAQSCLTLLTPWTGARQALLSREFSRPEDWSGLPFPPPGDQPDPGIEPRMVEKGTVRLHILNALYITPTHLISPILGTDDKFET